jgi:hypothetical protein
MDSRDWAARQAVLQRDLAVLNKEALGQRWLALKGVSLPSSVSRLLAAQALAHAMLEQEHGGLDPATRREIDVLMRDIVPKDVKPPAPKRKKLRAGTRLIREWQGEVHDVLVAVDGFLWRGARYRSLSVIAREITGTRWNGWTFFGLNGAAGIRDGDRRSRRGRPSPRRGGTADGDPAAHAERPIVPIRAVLSLAAVHGEGRCHG